MEEPPLSGDGGCGMSRAYPIIAPGGGIQLDGVMRDGEFHLVIGDLDHEPGAPELIIAIGKLADLASLWATPQGPVALSDLFDAIEALHLAGRVAA